MSFLRMSRKQFRRERKDQRVKSGFHRLNQSYEFDGEVCTMRIRNAWLAQNIADDARAIGAKVSSVTGDRDILLRIVFPG